MTLAYLLQTSMIRYYLQIAVLSHCPATDRRIPPNIPADPTLLSTLIKHCRPATHRHAGHSHTSSITLGWGGAEVPDHTLSRALGSCLAHLSPPCGMEIAWWCHEEGGGAGAETKGKLREEQINTKTHQQLLILHSKHCTLVVFEVWQFLSQIAYRSPSRFPSWKSLAGK